MYIVSTDNILSEAIGIILSEHGYTGIKQCRALPQTFDFAIVDIDSISIAAGKKILTVSADKRKGADITRPFFEDELFQKVNNRCRKPEAPPFTGSHTEESSNQEPSLCEGGFNYRGSFVALTPLEYSLLELLLQNINSCVSIERINRLFADSGVCMTNIACVYIRFLRLKLDFAFNERLIFTVRSQGYMFKSHNG